MQVLLTETRGLVQLLAAADRTNRAALYRALGLSLQYEKEAPTGRELVRARLELCGYVVGYRQNPGGQGGTAR